MRELGDREDVDEVEEQLTVVARSDPASSRARRWSTGEDEVEAGNRPQFGSGSGLLGGLAEPVLEAGRGDACVVARDEGPVVQLGAEVAGVNVGRHMAWVVARVQDTPCELVEGKRFRARQLDRVVEWCADRDIGQSAGDVIGCLGLNEGRRQPNRFPSVLESAIGR